MNNGYQQFFKKAQQIASTEPSVVQRPKIKLKQTNMSSESQLMTQQLRSRLKLKTKKNKRATPWKLVASSVIGVIIMGFGFNYASTVDKFIKNIEVSFLGIAVAEESASQNVKAAGEGVDPSKKAASVGNEKKEFSEEEINHFAKLNERKQELDVREEELARMEVELLNQKADLEKRMKELESTRRQISSTLEERVQIDDKKVEALVQVYSNMKPQQAAKVIETMDDDLAIEILGRMKKKPAAEILNLMKAERAQVFAERYAGYKRK